MRNIGLIGALSIGIGGMVGGGIFAVLGEAVSLAHGATAVSFLIAGIVALLTAYSYAKLSIVYQSEGGTVTFIDKAFGNNILTGSINLISASFVSKSESIIVAIKLTLLIVVIVAGSSYIEPQRLSIENWGGSSLSIITAGMIIFVAYEGFELIANSAEEIKNPDKNLPRAFYGSVIIVITLYILISIIIVGNVPEDALLKAKDYALAIAAKPSLGDIGFTLVASAALLSTFSAINATIYGNARLGFIIAKDGRLPKDLAKERDSIPFVGIIYTLIFSLILANTIKLNEIAIIGSAGFLLIFFIVNISAYRLRKKIDANPIILILSSILTLFSLITLLSYTYNSNPNAVIIFIFFTLFSLLFELTYGRYRKILI